VAHDGERSAIREVLGRSRDVKPFADQAASSEPVPRSAEAKFGNVWLAIESRNQRHGQVPAVDPTGLG